jgi:hypothetical protein
MVGTVCAVSTAGAGVVLVVAAGGVGLIALPIAAIAKMPPKMLRRKVF